MRRFQALSVIGLWGCAAVSIGAPLDIPDLKLWLDAEQNVTKDATDNVSLWGDVTGASNNTVAQDVGNTDPNKQPLWVDNVIGGKPVIRFDGFNDALEQSIDNLLGSGIDRTVFFVGQASTGDAHGDGLGGTMVSIRRGSLDGTATFFATQIYDNVGWDVFDEECCGTADPTAFYTDGISVNAVLPQSTFPNSNILQPFVSEHRVANSELTVAFNAAELPVKRLFNNESPSPVSPETSSDTGVVIGTRADKGGAQSWEGDIAEVLVYERSLSIAERQSVYDYLGTKYGLTLAPVGVPGDYNGNGVVDAADYVVWRDTLDSTTDLRANGDNTGASEGKIDAADYQYWTTRFGNTSGSGGGSVAGGNTAVPEPSSIAMLLVAGLSILGCRVRPLKFEHRRIWR